MPFAEDQHPVGDLRPDGEHEPFRITVRPRAPGRDLRDLVGAENLCHQAIFMDHASGAVTAPDTEVIQIDDAIRQRAERRGLV
jgi:hypothetical protein